MLREYDLMVVVHYSLFLRKSVGTSASAPSGSAANIVRLDLDDD